MKKSTKSFIKRALSAFCLQPTHEYPYLRRHFRFRPSKKPRSVLKNEFFQPTELVAADSLDESLVSLAVFQAWRGIPHAHKWPHYFPTYERALAHFNNKPIQMLEIGVYRGGSLAMWRRVLHADSTIVGIDIDETASQFEDRGQKLHVRIGDQSDPAFLRDVVTEFGPFDFILDDGSHICSHMIASFNHLFLEGLRPGGIYLIEDVHSNYWSSHRDMGYSFLDLAKDLTDYMHAHYWKTESERDFRANSPDRARSIVVPRISAHIRELRFEDSLITIVKERKSHLPASVHQ